MKKILFITNIPAPYRIDFFNELGKLCKLTVVFEARRAAGVRFNWNEEGAAHFTAVFLSDGDIQENRVDRRILPYIRRGEYDRIVATSYGYYTETAALLKMRLTGVPYAIEIDGGVVRPGENPVKRLLKRFLIRGAERLYSSGAASDRVFLHYGASGDRIFRYPFTSLMDADLLSLPLSPEEKRAAKAALGITGEKLVLSVGQFIHRKGYDLLLSAAGSLQTGTELVIIGGTPTEEYRRIVAEQGLTNVRFLPFLEKEPLRRWLLAADVFVLPTREDMWGLVVNEAMACALPVVTTDRCNAGVELVENGINGYITPIEDGAAQVDRVNAILRDDGLRTRMGEASLKKIRGYTIEQMAREHMRSFEG